MDILAPIALAAIGFAAAMTAGVFLSFSDFIMRGLRQADPAAGMDGMIQINRTVLRSIFLTSFLGLAPLSLGIMIWAHQTQTGLVQALLIAGGAVYLLGVFIVTMVGNVPMNQRLDGLDPDHDDGQVYWARYVSDWTRLNHIRTAANAVASIAFLAAAGVMLAV